MRETVHAKKRILMEEVLNKGKESAIQLRTLLQDPVMEEYGSGEELAMKILTSFTDTLSMVGSDYNYSSESPHSAQIDAVYGGGSGGGFTCDDERKPAGVNDRRGHYKRKRTSYSRIILSSTMEDGRGWRKYGQKKIFNSQYPRCYYRCTHKSQGCNAIKQVQKIKEEPFLYRVTYYNHHTCTTDNTLILPQLIVESDPFEANLLSFQPNKIPSIQENGYPQKSIIFSSPKQEPKEDTQPIRFPASAKSSVLLYPSSWPHQGFNSSASFGYEPAWSQTMFCDDQEEKVRSCRISTSLGHELDMEVNYDQLGDRL